MQHSKLQITTENEWEFKLHTEQRQYILVPCLYAALILKVSDIV